MPTASPTFQSQSRGSCDSFLNSMEERRPLIKRTASRGVDIRSAKKRQCACAAVLVIEALERCAFYSLTANLVLFLNKSPRNWMSYNAVNATFIFNGIGYVTSLLGGYLADAFLGRYRTILLSFLVYAGGYSLFPMLTKQSDAVPAFCLWQPPANGSENPPLENISIKYPPKPIYSAGHPMAGDEPCAWLVYLALAVVAVGAGSVKTNVAPFGADQVKSEGPEAMRAFFNWYYWSVNLGSLVALGGVAYLQQGMARGFFWGYISGISCLALAMFVCLISSFAFQKRDPSGSVLTSVVNIFREAIRNKRRQKRHNLQGMVQSSTGSSSTITASGSSQAGAAVRPTLLDWAKVRYGGVYHESMVEDVKNLRTIFIVLFALIPYWMVYFQMESTFLVQGLHMKLQAKPDSEKHHHDQMQNFQIPAAWLTLFDAVSLLLLIPLFDRVIYPALDRRGRHLSLLTRIIIGMSFSMFAVVVAGGLELYRLDFITTHNNSIIKQTIDGTTYNAADLWVFWQIPQYVLVGVSEVFASVAGLEFAYSQAPRSMRSIIMGMFLVFCGIGSLLGSALMFIVKKINPNWFNKYDNADINYGRLDIYFFILGGVQLFTVVIFAGLTQTLRQRRQQLLQGGGASGGGGVRSRRNSQTSVSGGDS